MNQPTVEERKELLDLFKKEKVNIPGTKKCLKIGYLKGYTLEKISELSIEYGQKINTFNKKSMKFKTRMAVKVVSYGVLNGMKIYFFNWIYWRWLYYVKGYGYEQLEPIMEVIKKKVPVKLYSKTTILVPIMDITMMAMSKEEYEAIRQELLSDKEDKSVKITNGL